MRSSLAKALSDAAGHHAHGRLSEAEAGYRSVLQNAPDQPDALHRLGMIAHQVGRNEAALELIDRAIMVNPVQPTYYNDAGIVLQALGRNDEAIARFRQALALAHAYPRAHNGLGIALHDQGRLDEAIASFRTALSLKPDYADAQNNLANVLREQGRAAEAVQIYRKALETRDVPDVRYNLASALSDLGAFDDAAQAYAKALIRRETPDAIAGFVQSLVAAELRHADDDVRRMALRALAAPWARPSELSAACIRLLASGAAMRECIDRAWIAWPARVTLGDLLGGVDPGVVFDDALLRALLESAPVCDLSMERFLTLARFALLDAAIESRHPANDDRLAFCCALARQCFIDDYVFACTGTEIERASALRNVVAASLERGEAVAPVPVAIVAAYFPLISMPQREALLARTWPEPLDALLTQQLREPLEERGLRDRLRRLTEIDDRVSIDVRRQYEEHPYPSWVRLPSPAPTSPAGAGPGGRFPLELRQSGERDLDILVAGCGTGQESIELAYAFPRARVLAIDLSLASLAYAERKARELYVANLEHAQADIMNVAALGRRFDVISSVGVLHHLADPVAGWRELVAMLAPGGHMLVGLYSERSRQDVVAARAFIAAAGYLPTDTDIRRCRQDLLSSDHAVQIDRLTRRSDFYVTGECRDLLFHVQEHRFTLPRIAEAIDALGLRFNGFLLGEDLARRYAEHYPDDPGMENLDNWDRLEAQLPQAFAGMYIFWVQKAR
ncbi:MAG TPA: tetratricopeptide repeat protein [Casimicrobiaceae bacterium]|nr:tetratricopeptide repeat protein [Casimicrobiaceae bacterium]